MRLFTHFVNFRDDQIAKIEKAYYRLQKITPFSEELSLYFPRNKRKFSRKRVFSSAICTSNGPLVHKFQMNLYMYTVKPLNFTCLFFCEFIAKP